ncbi:unnamed protein product [Clonostachys byssicola]|uniref:HNH nuclease domain-containing protein n=1 Tax=Clonostachys byssicola TaxID=160290 RepID=A0A9N9U344_9HYPO|nr:unnamed protein product [Clonostachys byssicola]
MPRLPDDQIQEAQSAFDAFVTRETGHPSDHAALLRLLQHQTPMNTNIKEVRNPIPDQTIRIRKVYHVKRELNQRFGDDFVFTHLHQIGILLCSRTFTLFGDINIRDTLVLLEPFLARFLPRNTPIPPDVKLPTNSPQPTTKEADRNRNESKDTLERDGKRCLVTNAIKPDVCHIIPPELNTNPATEPGSRLIYGKLLRNLLTWQDSEDLFDLLFPTDELCENVPSSAERQWNMLTLSPQVCRYWRKCFFAFKWVGVLNPDTNEETQAVQLEFRWIPRSIATALGDAGLGEPEPQHAHKGNAFRPVKTDTMTWERMAEIVSDCISNSSPTSTVHPRYQQPDEEYPTLVDHDYFLPIKSGHIINVNGIKREDVPKMKLAIDLQYVAHWLGGMSGAADAIESLDPRVPSRHTIRHYDRDTDTMTWELYTPFAELRELIDEEGEEKGAEEEDQGEDGEDGEGGEEMWLLL